MRVKEKWIKHIIPPIHLCYVDFRSALMHMLRLIMYKVKSENGYGLLRPGLKTGAGNGIFWSEIVSGFGDAGGTPPAKIPRSTPLPRGAVVKLCPEFCDLLAVVLMCLQLEKLCVFITSQDTYVRQAWHSYEYWPRVFHD